ncbi:hypothetical protein H7H37_11755, partial [Mycolicibacterium insubricum]|nr:hypothetical protein [Mycolicibacterium insubricum]
VSGPLLLQYPLYGGLVGLLGYHVTRDGKPLQTLLAEALVHGAADTSLEAAALELLPNVRGAFCLTFMDENTLYAAR